MPDFTSFFAKNGLNPRPQQIEVLEKLEQNWDKYKYHVVNAPTGVGKSFIALAVAMGTPKSFLLTATKNLQDQYLDTCGELVNIKGRGNYKCDLNPTLRADTAPCTVMPALASKCIGRGACTYHKVKVKALASKVMLTNYSYFLYSTHCGPLSDVECRRDTLICDEAHDLETALVGFAETTISPEQLEKDFKLKDISWRFNEDEKHNLEVLDSITAAVEKACCVLKSQIDSVYAKFGVSSEDPFAASKMPQQAIDKIGKIGRELYTLDKVLQPVKIFQSQRGEHRWIINGDVEKNELLLSPLSANGIFESYVGGMADKFLMMSATTGPPDVFARELGIPMDQVNFVDVRTDFPAENSPIVYVPVGKMNYRDIETTLPRLIAGIDQIMTAHGDEKGIIHSVNYRITKAIAEGLSDKNRRRLLFRDMKHGFKLTNEELVKEHNKTKAPSVLLSPSLGVGTSLDDDLSRWQVIVKMPFASLGDPRVKEKSDLDKEWYLWRMWIEVMQASGRSTRSKEDHSVTYVMDTSFDWFFNQAKSRLPGWFKERVHLI